LPQQSADRDAIRGIVAPSSQEIPRKISALNERSLCVASRICGAIAKFEEVGYKEVSKILL
jgi:hypothetical protein